MTSNPRGYPDIYYLVDARGAIVVLSGNPEGSWEIIAHLRRQQSQLNETGGEARVTLQVQLLTFGDCPNRDTAMERLRVAIAEERVSADVTEVEVADSKLAQELRFLGSPSVRINGVDVEPAARLAEQFGLMCRTYRTAHGPESAPPIEMIRAALRMLNAAR